MVWNTGPMGYNHNKSWKLISSATFSCRWLLRAVEPPTNPSQQLNQQSRNNNVAFLYFCIFYLCKNRKLQNKKNVEKSELFSFKLALKVYILMANAKMFLPQMLLNASLRVCSCE